MAKWQKRGDQVFVDFIRTAPDYVEQNLQAFRSVQAMNQIHQKRIEIDSILAVVRTGESRDFGQGRRAAGEDRLDQALVNTGPSARGGFEQCANGILGF